VLYVVFQFFVYIWNKGAVRLLCLISELDLVCSVREKDARGVE